MKNLKLDPYEKEILKEVEAGNFVSIDSPKLRKEAIIAAENTLKKLAKDKSISIRLNNEDLNKLKNKAEKKGIKYQTLISILIHQYANEELDIKL